MEWGTAFLKLLTALKIGSTKGRNRNETAGNKKGQGEVRVSVSVWFWTRCLRIMRQAHRQQVD
jgi:hypothetical protein